MARRKNSLKILFVADPLESFNPASETTLYLMKESARRGHRLFHCRPQDLSAQSDEVITRCREVQIQRGQGPSWFRTGPIQRIRGKSFSAILLRKDPPFDQNYLHHLYLLELISNEVYMMNHPSGILVGNEKLIPLPFHNRVPQTLVSASKEELQNFIRKQKKGAVIKPLNYAGGRGVYRIQNLQSENCNVILEAATQGFTHHVVAQAYLPAAKQGDKRIMLLGQEVLGAFARVPAPGEHRANLHAGGRAKKVRLTRQDLELVALLRPTLEHLGLDFVGLDVIGGKLIEVNVTSPMGLNEINQTSGGRSESKVLDFIENRVG
jgi:glutathione synthase